MRIYCVAIVYDERQAENLKDCIKLLGAEPIETNGCVEVDYTGNIGVCETLIELFEQFADHGIYSETPT